MAPLFFISALDGMGSQCHALALYPNERPSTHFAGGWVGSIIDTDSCGNLTPHQDLTPRLYSA